ncbi:MAG: phospholipase D-like domain-containing protein, partial [Microcystis sp. M53601_WE4]|nr:phospholipase D-like domain-containing protein [Microcystis sp. M53601_WE4]
RQINRPGDNLEQVIIDNINSAKSSIDLAVQELRLPAIAQALVERQQQGIKVRVILENIYNQPIHSLAKNQEQLSDREQERYQNLFDLVDLNRDGKLSAEEIAQRDAITILKKAGIPLIDDRADRSKGSGLMHHKFMVIDNYTTLISSANYTLSDIHGDFSNPQTVGNANHLLVINNPPLARVFQREFNLMWGREDSPKFGLDKPQRKPQTITIGNSSLTVKFSPDSTAYPWAITSNGLIGETLNQAKKSVNLALFVLTEQPLANILAQRHQKGIEIKALIDPSFAFRYYSEGLDLLGVALSNKCRYEPDNQPWQNPINTLGVPDLAPGDKLHHKFGLIDDKIVITGSHNWSAAANHQNDEALVIIDNPTVAAHFDREFQYLYRTAKLGLPETIKNRIEQDRKNCPQSVTIKSDRLINLNTATREELDSLPGISGKLAEKIIAARQQKPFTSLEDLDRVSGIGQGKISKLKGKVSW